MCAARASRGHCDVCGGDKRASELMPGGVVRESLGELIRAEHPDWSSDGHICRECLDRYRSEYLQRSMETERGELSELELDVMRAIQKRELVSENSDDEYDRSLTAGQRAADVIARFGGSWAFIGTFAAVLIAWITINSVALFVRHFDPFPFILLNLCLSSLAAVQAPVIMMSQNRQESRDRTRAEHDYQVNLKAEMEIRHLHEKVDHLLTHQWERLTEIQQIQVDLLNELVRSKRA